MIDVSELDAIAGVLAGHRFVYDDETGLQALMARALTDAGYTPLREVPLARAGRIDLMCGTIGIEVKVDGTPAQVTRQLVRYAHTPTIEGLILATSRISLRTAVRHAQQRSIIPIRCVVLAGAF